MRFWLEAVLRIGAVLLVGSVMAFAHERWGEGGGGSSGPSTYTRQTVSEDLASSDTGGPGLHTLIFTFPIKAGLNYNILCNLYVKNNSSVGSTAAQLAWYAQGIVPARFYATHWFCNGANITPSNQVSALGFLVPPADDTNSTGPAIGNTCADRLYFGAWAFASDTTIDLSFQSDASGEEVQILAGSYCDQLVVP